MAMRAPQESRLLTAEEASQVTVPGKSFELVRGRLVVMEPPSTEHGRIQANISFVLSSFVRMRDLVAVFGQDTGFKIASNPDTVRGPDVSFAVKERLAELPTRGYAAFAPDLVIEIVSPGDRPGELLAKIGDWLDAGARLAWVIDPQRQEARVYRPDGSLTLIAADGSLDGEDVLPGFSASLSEMIGSS